MKKTTLLLVLLCLCLPLAARQRDAVGTARRDGIVVPTGQTVRPVGESVQYSGRPVDLALAPDGKTLYAKDERGLVAIDAVAWTLRQELKFAASGGSLHGLAINRDGSRIYATNALNDLAVAEVGANGILAWKRQIALPGPKGSGASFPCGIALSPDERTAYVCLSINNTLAVVDLTDGRLVREIPVGIAPFDVVLAPDGASAFVSDWGGRRPKPGERTAKSAGSDTLVDERGVASSGCVSIVDVKQGVEVAQIATDLHPSDLELRADGQRLYVANANSDTVSVIDVAARRVVETIPVRPMENLPFGSAPNALALAPDGKTLYVANGGNNAVAVIALSETPGQKSRVTGFIPAGWYPGALVCAAKHLLIANIKGLGSRGRDLAKSNPKPATADSRGRGVYEYLGTIQRVPYPDAAALRRYTAQARADARLPEVLRARERAQGRGRPVPVPARAGEPSVFQHVVYVIKENRTYDQVFGDLPQGNGDPALCLFGRNVTPNHHALAEQFVLLDNFYCNGVLSADGHQWATEGNVTDHLEKAFGGFTRSYTFGDDPISYSSSGFLWDNVLAAGLSFRNYGEMDYATPVPSGDFTALYRDFVAKTGKFTYTQNIGIERLKRYSCPTFPGWNMDIPDVLRAEVFLKELKDFERQGTFPNLVIVYLPSDHTSGTSPGSPTPRAQIADNDLALGRVVEGISKSRFWPTTCIFVVEDDPQDGFDHIDGHRSPCLVVSPYTKRGAVIHNFYNQTSVLHTMQRILGLTAMNQMDAAAPLMRACFTNRPDFRPYTCLPNGVPLDEMNPKASALKGKALYWAQKSLEQRFDRIDGADEDTLNRILWHSVKGVNTPYPAHLAGAHGRGLKALRLKHTEEDNNER